LSAGARPQARRSTIIFLISAMALAGLSPLGQVLGAIHDGVAAIEAERILEMIDSFARRLIPRIDQPAIGLE
jgi:hypothetical protein